MDIREDYKNLLTSNESLVPMAGKILAIPPTIGALMKTFPYDVTKLHQEFVSSLTEHDRQVIRFYQQENYADINTFTRTRKLKFSHFHDQAYLFNPRRAKTFVASVLRKEIPAYRRILRDKIHKKFTRISHIVARLTDIIRRAPRAIQEFDLYRGISSDLGFAASGKYSLRQVNLVAGATFNSKGFNSFSLSPMVALNFMNTNDICCLYKLRLTASVPHLIIPYGNTPHEFEVTLLPSQFKVVGVKTLSTKEGSLRVYELEWVREL